MEIDEGLFLFLLSVDSKNVTFGTGFRYKPYAIPLKYLESVTNLRTVVALKFKEDPSVPMALITSAGINYSLYLLRLNRIYMNRSCADVVAALQKHLPQDLA